MFKKNFFLAIIVCTAFLFSGVLAWGDTNTYQLQLDQKGLQSEENVYLAKSEGVSDANAQWAVYIDETWGFSIEYPSDWSVEVLLENTDKPEYVVKKAVAFKGPNGPSIVLNLWTSKDEPELMEWFSNNAAHLNSQQAQVPQAPNITVGDNEGIMFYNPQIQSASQLLAVFKKGHLYFRLEYRISDQEQSKDIFEHMLTSFK